MPVSIAPYQIHLVELAGSKEESTLVQEISNRLYEELQEAGLEVLFDDRDESPGVKFNDADLIGIPLRITVGHRSLKEGEVEFKLRHQSEKELIPLDEAVERSFEIIQELYREIEEAIPDRTLSS
jgi:prolyl-tRNA synthetase